MSGFISGLMSKMKLNDSEYLEEFDDETDEEEAAEAVRKSSGSKKSRKFSSKKSFTYDYDDIDDDDDYNKKTSYSSGKKSVNSHTSSQPKGRKIVSMNRNSHASASYSDTAMEVRVHRPIDVNSAEDICMDLMDGKAVLINFITVDEAVMQRIVDIVSGATLAIDGKVRLISDMIAVFAPKDIDITGNFEGYVAGRIGVPSLGSFDYDEEEEI